MFIRGGGGGEGWVKVHSTWGMENDEIFIGTSV